MRINNYKINSENQLHVLSNFQNKFIQDIIKYTFILRQLVHYCLKSDMTNMMNIEVIEKKEK